MDHLGLLLAGGFVVGPALRTGAQSSVPNGFVGAWQLTVSPTGETTSPSLATFGADGTLLVADPPVVPAPPGAPAKLIFISAGHGVWTSTGASSAALTFVELNSQEGGFFIGTFTVRGTAELAATGDALSGAFTYTIAGAGGEPVGSGAGTFTGTRIVVEPMATPVGTPSS